MATYEPYEIRPLPKYLESSPLAKYYYHPKIAPQEYWDDIGDNTAKDPSLQMTIQNRCDIFKPGYRPIERGWSILPDGTGTCAGYMMFPNCTPEMLYWWFSWSMADPIRGMMWEPKNHIGCITTRDQIEKACDYSVPLEKRMHGIHWFPIDLGVRPDPNAEPAPCRIQVYSPAEFGMEEAFEQNKKDVAMLCYQVGPIGGRPITSFIHTMRRVEGGAELRSQFWYGWRFENGQPVHADVILPEIPMTNTCKTQNIHLIEEYYQLSQILAELYAEYGDKQDDPHLYF